MKETCHNCKACNASNVICGRPLCDSCARVEFDNQMCNDTMTYEEACQQIKDNEDKIAPIPVPEMPKSLRDEMQKYYDNPYHCEEPVEEITQADIDKAVAEAQKPARGRMLMAPAGAAETITDAPEEIRNSPWMLHNYLIEKGYVCWFD